MARDSSDTWIKRNLLARLRSTRRGEEGPNTSSDDQEDGRPSQQPDLQRRRSLRNRLVSRSSHSLHGQLKSKASSKFLRGRRLSHTENTSDGLEQPPSRLAAEQTSQRLPPTDLPKSHNSLDPPTEPSAHEQVQVPHRIKTITFEDQKVYFPTLQRDVSISNISLPLVDLDNTDKPSSMSPGSSLSYEGPSFRIATLQSSQTTDLSLADDHCNQVQAHRGNNSNLTQHHRTPEQHHEAAIERHDKPGEQENFNLTDTGSRPTKIIRIVAAPLEDDDTSLTGIFGNSRDLTADKEELGHDPTVYLRGIGSWVEQFDDAFSRGNDKVSDTIEELELFPIEIDIITSFLSLNSDSKYAVQVESFIGRVGPFVSAWLLSCITELRIEKLRLSLFIQTTALVVGIDLYDRFDLSPDDLVRETWYVDDASMMAKSPRSPTGKPTGKITKISTNMPQATASPDTVKPHVISSDNDVLDTSLVKKQDLDLNIQSSTCSTQESHAIWQKANNSNSQISILKSSQILPNEASRRRKENVLLPQLTGWTMISNAAATAAAPSVNLETGKAITTDQDNAIEANGKSKSIVSAEESGDASVRMKDDDELRSVASLKEPQHTDLAAQSVQTPHPGGHFFVKGRVFSVVWHEPAKSSNKSPRRLQSETAMTRNLRTLTETVNGDLIYSHVRKFVVVTHRRGFCLAVPISSYGGKGLSRRKFTEAERKGHAIVYLEGEKPHRLKGERPFTKEPIAVEQASQTTHLDPASRINFRKPTPIEWNSRVDNIGFVSSSSISHLTTYFKDELVTSDDD